MAKGKLRAAIVSVVNKAQDNRNERVSIRNERRATQAALKYQSRTDRVEARQSGKTDRKTLREGTKQVAYKSGFDPNAAWSNVAGKAVDAAGSFLTNTPYQSSGEYVPSQQMNYDKLNTNNESNSSGMGMLPVFGIIALVLIFLFGGNKTKTS